ncbi:unnamed protein product, partial [Amoebophrya sp. A120]
GAFLQSSPLVGEMNYLGSPAVTSAATADDESKSFRRGSPLTSFTLGTSLKAHATRLSTATGKRRVPAPTLGPGESFKVPALAGAFRTNVKTRSAGTSLAQAFVDDAGAAARTPETPKRAAAGGVTTVAVELAA